MTNTKLVVYLRRDSIEEGREEGFEEGREKGLAEGYEKGQSESKKEIARKMKERGFDDDTISQMTGIGEF